MSFVQHRVNSIYVSIRYKNTNENISSMPRSYEMKFNNIFRLWRFTLNYKSQHEAVVYLLISNRWHDPFIWQKVVEKMSHIEYLQMIEYHHRRRSTWIFKNTPNYIGKELYFCTASVHQYTFYSVSVTHIASKNNHKIYFLHFINLSWNWNQFKTKQNHLQRI